MFPQAKIVKGFDPIMPTFQGLLHDFIRGVFSGADDEGAMDFEFGDTKGIHAEIVERGEGIAK